MNLNTSYLGLSLRNPIIVGASPLIYDMDKVRALEDNGAGAIVMHSLFEEQIEQSVPSGSAKSLYPQAAEFRLNPDSYLQQIQQIKTAISCPLIGSLNGLSEGGWIEYAKKMEDAGADALELNLYFLPRSDDESASVVEQRAHQVVRMVRQYVKIPVSVKLSPAFTSLINVAHRMENAGAHGLVLFNRFFQPDIDIESMESVSRMGLTPPGDLLLRLRWLSVLYGRIRCDMAATGGIYTSEDVIKALMAGATAVQVVSAVMRDGPTVLTQLRSGLEAWLASHDYESVDELRGAMSYMNAPAPDVIGRAQYMELIQNWRIAKDD